MIYSKKCDKKIKGLACSSTKLEYALSYCDGENVIVDITTDKIIMKYQRYHDCNSFYFAHHHIHYSLNDQILAIGYSCCRYVELYDRNNFSVSKKIKFDDAIFNFIISNEVFIVTNSRNISIYNIKKSKIIYITELKNMFIRGIYQMLPKKYNIRDQIREIFESVSKEILN